jgi:hypothetical protein
MLGVEGSAGVFELRRNGTGRLLMESEDVTTISHIVQPESLTALQESADAMKNAPQWCIDVLRKPLRHDVRWHGCGYWSKPGAWVLLEDRVCNVARTRRLRINFGPPPIGKVDSMAKYWRVIEFNSMKFST